MTGMGELTSLQAPLVDALVGAGWAHVPGSQLERPVESVLVEPEVSAALVRLNPVIAEEPGRAEEVLRQLRTIPLAALDAGLVESNRDFAEWLRGLHTHEFIGTHGSQTVNLIDFQDLSNNTFVVSDEVRFGAGSKVARFDVVLWVNGIPLAVGELKTPVSRNKVTWMTGANELLETYQLDWPGFFVPNALVFASEGKEFRYAGVGTPVDHWGPWGAIKESPRLADVIKSATSLLSPQTLLDMLVDYTLFELPDSNDEGAPSLRKIVARYTQYKAVELLVGRVKDPERNKGLIYHTQGSGKTLAMVFAARQLVRDPAMRNPTIVLVADRVQLVQQMTDQFRTTGVPRLQIPGSVNELQRLLSQDRRGLVFTTVHKFKGAPVLSERENIIVLVDEAHRTQYGDLGMAMRRSLPNAQLFAFTGTPLSSVDRNTFEVFGEESDPDRTLHAYTSDESIRDGMTVPLHVAPRAVKFALDRDALDEAFKEMSEQEGLSESEQESLARRSSRTIAFFSNPERIEKVCADMVEHFYSTVDPLGMKAQVVVIDRAACVAYAEELEHLLAARHQEAMKDDPDAVPDEVAVVMTVGTAKGDPPEWSRYALTDAEEAALLRRFRTHGDPLKFLVCTSKLGTGFDAPIEGVLYLDKPLKEHTLFQTITRANRRWRNPETQGNKRYGLIVDYVGLGAGFARAIAPAKPNEDAGDSRGYDVAELIEQFVAQLDQTMLRFAGIDTDKPGPQTLMDAQARMPRPEDEDHFIANFEMLEGIWETLAPHEGLHPHRGRYRFLSQVYASIQPTGSQNDLRWHRLGVKTRELIHQHMQDISVTHGDEVVIADAETVKTLIDEGFGPEVEEVEGKTVEEVIDSIAERLKERQQTGRAGGNPRFKSLSERLERLRQNAIAGAQQSIEWLRKAFELARDVTAAEKLADEGGDEALALIPDPRIGALTQIFREYAPDDTPGIIERVVNDIDAIVREVRYDGWSATADGDRLVRREVRTTLRKHQMHNVDGLFDRAYAYIAEHY